MDYREMGKKDCENNQIPKNGMPEAYYLGYSEQYAKEQQLSQGDN
jgi:hypothetical protein